MTFVLEVDDETLDKVHDCLESALAMLPGLEGFSRDYLLAGVFMEILNERQSRLWRQVIVDGDAEHERCPEIWETQVVRFWLAHEAESMINGWDRRDEEWESNLEEFYDLLR